VTAWQALAARRSVESADTAILPRTGGTGGYGGWSRRGHAGDGWPVRRRAGRRRQEAAV